jgi:hypothetical protein
MQSTAGSASLHDETSARMPKNVVLPLLALNVVFVLMLVTLGPRYGWAPLVLAGALVSAVNLFAVRAAARPPRR